MTDRDRAPEGIEGEAEDWTLLDFWEPTCGTCQSMEPVLEHVTARLGDRLRVVRIDATIHPSLARRLGVRSLPTFVLQRGGAPVDRFVGLGNRREFLAWLEPLIGAAERRD